MPTWMEHKKACLYFSYLIWHIVISNQVPSVHWQLTQLAHSSLYSSSMSCHYQGVKNIWYWFNLWIGWSQGWHLAGFVRCAPISLYTVHTQLLESLRAEFLELIIFVHSYRMTYDELGTQTHTQSLMYIMISDGDEWTLPMLWVNIGSSFLLWILIQQWKWVGQDLYQNRWYHDELY